MLYDLIETYGKVGQSGRNDDDVFDRFSHRWTIILLAVFTLTLTAKQLVGEPIECIAPSNFDGHQKTYVENFCWIHYTYSIDENTALTRDFVRGANGSRRTPYYIWIPYILIVAILCTYLPAWLWHVIGHRLTFDIPAMINQIAKTNLTDTDERQKNLLALAKHYHRAHRYTQVEMKSGIHVVRKLVSIGMFFAGGGMLTGTYFFIKLCYLFNAIGQFMLMNAFLRIDYWSYGQTVVLGLLRGSDWLENKIIFPRIVFCDFTIRYLGDNNPNYTVQCTLPVNLYNERIFAFYWFWLVFLALVTAYGIVHWLFQMSYRNRRSFLKKHLRVGSRWISTEANRKLFPRFIDTYLGGDGILFLRLISKNTSPVITGELLGLMWKQFEENERALKEVKVFQVDTFLNGRETVKTD